MEVADDKSRTLEEISEILHLAKLHENDILPVSQTIYYTPGNLHNNNFKLLQLDNAMLNEINKGQTLFIKGNADENVVICSDKRTYDVVEAETSNSLLLVDNMQFSSEVKGITERTINKMTVCGTFYEYLEIVLGKPKLKKLEEILSNTTYKGPEHEYSIDSTKLVTFDDLDSEIQSSRSELKEVLAEMDVVCIDNKLRLLDFEYHFRVLSYMLKLIEENSWELDEVDFEETIKSLEDLVPFEVLNNLFEKYTEDSQIIDGLQLYRYKEKEICTFFAKVLLSHAGKFNLSEFLQAWSESVPEGMVPDEDMLNGIAIIDRKSNPNVIFAYPEHDLPTNINDRFSVLFEKKEKWSVPEITPYIRKLATGKLDVNALLAKHARASTIEGVKYYCAKHYK